MLSSASELVAIGADFLTGRVAPPASIPVEEIRAAGTGLLRRETYTPRTAGGSPGFSYASHPRILTLTLTASRDTGVHEAVRCGAAQ